MSIPFVGIDSRCNILWNMGEYRNIMITTEKKIRIYDDTGNGDSFDMIKLLYESENLILCNVINEWYEGELTVLIYKDSNDVFSKELNFYLAENY